MANDIFFVIETAMSKNGKKLKALEPDEQGWYHGVPVCVLDESVITRNNSSYDVQSIKEQVNNPKSLFNVRLTDGDLFGEYNHPFLPNQDVNRPEVLARLLWLDPSLKACHYRKFEVNQDPDIKTKLLYATLKPMGPYGPYAKELLDDPYVNFSTSLRGISEQKVMNGVLRRRLIKLVTFDVAVPGSGYEYTSKRYAKISLENLTEIISHEGMLEISNASIPTISVESIFSDTEINEILKMNKIEFKGKITAIKINTDEVFIEETKSKHSLYHITRNII